MDCYGDSEMTARDHSAELLASCKELREACAACFRVIARVPNLSEKLEVELRVAGVEKGFGKRAGDLISKVERPGTV